MASLGEQVAALLAVGAVEGVGATASVGALSVAWRRIIDRVREALAARPPRSVCLDRLGVDALDSAAVAELAAALDQRIASDPAFGDALRRELREVGGAANEFLTIVQGGAVGRIANIGMVNGDVTF
jgi:hypothetical protein